MRAQLTLAAFLLLLAAGCGGSNTTSPTTTRTAPIPPAPMAVTIFRVRRGLLRPAVVHVPRTPAVAAAALVALGVRARLTVASGTATVDLAAATEARQAEIVFTLSQFPKIERVDVAGRHRLVRSDFERYLPPILVEAPAAGSAVGPRFHVSGTASVFEATLVVALVRDGKALTRRTVTASEGAPGRGTFDGAFTATPGALLVRVFAPSAVDGSSQHEVDVSVTVRP